MSENINYVYACEGILIMCMHVKEIIYEYACIGIIMMCVHVQEYQLCACMYRNINYGVGSKTNRTFVVGALSFIGEVA